MSRESPKYRSKLEQQMGAFLDKRKIPFKYEDGKLPYFVRVQGGRCTVCKSPVTVKQRYYVPDFKVGAIVLETKGRLTSAERTKFIALNAAYPGTVVLVFQRDNFIRKGSKTTYSEWAKDQGIEAYVGVGNWPPKFMNRLRKEAKRE